MPNVTPIFVGALRNTAVKITASATDVNGSGSTALFSAGTDGSRIHAISATPVGSLASSVKIRFFLEQASTYWILGEKVIPTYTVGAAGAPTTSFIEFADMPFLDPADRFITLSPTQTLYVAALSVPDAAIHMICHGGDY